MLPVPRQCRGTHTQVQYSPWSSPPSLVLLIEEKEDQHRQYLQFGLHGVLVPRGVWRDCLRYYCCFNTDRQRCNEGLCFFKAAHAPLMGRTCSEKILVFQKGNVRTEICCPLQEEAVV
ncbi:hypothetical protein NDU88_005191 [Pleurodeles waltl]|uniref:Uncharacterized protein n=1 Tax=Pleurodeles waltl TaxID=8319 RepID=A0AAV7M997_PLEWA|nr:hypothetical protein NDU88_005191 [Pleurodeles waltl]